MFIVHPRDQRALILSPLPLSPSSLYLTFAQDEMPDVVVIGVQECQYDVSLEDGKEGSRRHESRVLRKELRKIKTDFLRRVLSHLGEEYYAISNYLGEMRLGIFIRRALQPFVHGVSTRVERTGLGHVGENKGGIVIALHIAETRLCFVSAHLAAHEGEGYRERRNADCAEILRGTLEAGAENSSASRFSRMFSRV